MKIMACLLLVMAALIASGCAEEESALPGAILDLCEKAHPGYGIAAHDGWGDAQCGQFALILKKGEDNILCVAEKAQEDAAYHLTIDNTSAVYDGDTIPSLMIDTGGDVLFYGYYEGNDAVHYHTEKKNGKWAALDVTAYVNQNDGHRCIQSGVGEGYLYYDEDIEDENGNILHGFSYAPILVGAAFEAAMEPQNFDINLYDADPVYGLFNMSKMPGMAESWLKDGERLIAVDLECDHVILLLEQGNGKKRLRIASLEGGLYRIKESCELPSDMGMDAFHAGGGELILTRNGGMTLYGFKLRHDGRWQMTYVQGRNGVVLLHDGMYSMDSSVFLRNDGVIYGVHPWNDLLNIDFSDVPETLEEAAGRIDRNAYALVCNPNPADRLHLRAKPDKSAHSYGKFYNRTPVLVLERGDTWTKVRIGSGEHCLTGYMMTKYLVFDEAEKAALVCAFPQKMLREERKDGVPMHTAPEARAVTPLLFEQQSGDFIIGVSGDNWYVVLCADGAVGYVLQSAFWDGNG